jgi:hypothetical protein
MQLRVFGNCLNQAFALTTGRGGIGFFPQPTGEPQLPIRRYKGGNYPVVHGMQFSTV